MSKPMWMVRAARGGKLADAFVEHGRVGIGWVTLGDLGAYADKQAILQALDKHHSDWSSGKKMSSASQLVRFRDELQEGDRVVTYNPGRRVYHVGTIVGGYRHEPDLIGHLANTRPVNWDGEVERERLSAATRNSLGAIMTLFQLPEHAVRELESLLQDGSAALPDTDTADEEDEDSLLEAYESQAVEIIKDRLNRLDWEQMQELVAGLLRAMGYRTRVSAPGPDRGVDIMASPDGFGFESPRIVVEVKHRGQAMGAQQIRSYLGGRHKDDKGLYVSTSGFTKEARYEAERANIPLMLMDIDDLVRALMEYYENLDMDTRSLLPLKKIYWPI